MSRWPAGDSRHYIVAFAMNTPADCPPDFALPPDLSHFETGLFLPRDDPDWFGRSAYPPRLLLLTRDAIRVVPHPGTDQTLFEFPIEEISSIESGHFLLKGWLRFTGSGFDCRIPYNTRGIVPVLGFMERLRGRLFAPGAAPLAPDTRPGAGLDIKFWNALTREIDRGEGTALVFFQAPKEVQSGRWFQPRRRSVPGDVLALTGRRLLWITDRDGGSYSRYGTIASYAPHRAVRSVELRADRAGHFLHVDLSGDCGWRIPVQPECLTGAKDFVTLAAIQKDRYGAGRTQLLR